MGNCVTQYIGARYVPLFADPIDWTDDRTYEPLTIVLHQGNSYTSRCTVPKGIDITDEYYWAQTGNYNAQVEQYRTEVGEYKTQVNCYIGKVDDAVEKVEQDMTQLREDVTAEMDQDMTQLREDVTAEMDQVKSEVQNDIQDVRDELADVDALAKTNESDIADLDATVNKILSNIDSSKVVNVRDLGAVGDGVTDDTQAFYKAIGTENNPAEYGIVIIPPGDYLVTEWLYVHSNLMILGPGHVINGCDKGGVFNWTVFEHDPTTKELKNFALIGVEITSQGGKTGKKNNGFQIYHAAYDSVRVENVVIQNCNFHDIGSRGVSIYSGHGTGGGVNHPKAEVIIANNKFENCGNICVHILGSSAKVVNNQIFATGDAEALTFDDGCTDCYLIGNYIAGNNYGGAGLISFDEGNGFVFVGNRFDGYGNMRIPCIRANCGSGDINHLSIVGNVIGGGLDGISLGNDDEGHSVHSCIVSGNVIYGSANQPLWISNNSAIQYGSNSCTWEDTDAQYIVDNNLVVKDTLMSKLYA